MPFRRYIRLILPAVALILMVACGGQSVQTTPAPIPPTDAPATEPPAATEAPATAEPAPTAEIEVTEPDDSLAGLPAGVFYDLGEATIIQANFPEDSRFRSMPVRLNGVLSVPESGDGPFPVVLILHGTHPGCPVNDMGVDAWPCDPLEERDNYAGFEYLVRELAARGYVALAININAENTFGFGEPVGGERLLQLVDLHLSALAAAAAGGANDFGVDLDGVANVQQLTLMGHSRGGDMVNWLAGDRLNGPNLAAPDAFATHGYGPVNGLLLIAPAVALFGSEGTAVPLAAIISACDGDVTDGSGQDFYEQVRLDEDSPALATSVVLAEANHNGFNTTLGGDGFPPTDRPDCQTLLEPEAQRQFLVDYAADFLTLLDSPDAAERSAAAARLVLDAGAPAPAELYGQAVQLASHAAAADRLTVFVPADEGDMTTNRLGGTIIADNITNQYCEMGYSTPQSNPGSEPCLRPNVTIPGYPAMAVVNWEGEGGAWRFELPEGARDLSGYTTVSLRAAVDPLSPLNVSGEPQALSIRLTDGAGNSDTVATRPDEPALAFPVGATREDEIFGQVFSSLVPLTTIRLPLDGFAGVDLSDVTEIAILFDQTTSGYLFLGDLELIRPPQAGDAN